MSRRPTILDVARKAGVSKSTVSLVLQDSKTVKDSTRVAVKEAMAEIGYVYNRSAATLRSASSGLIGLVINDLRNPFFTEFATSLQMALAESGYATVIANDESVTHALPQGRKCWVQVARGSVRLNEQPLHAGDGVAIEGAVTIALTGATDTEVLLFDMG